MVPQKIILQGGEDAKKRTNQQMFREVALLSEKRRMLIIPWTTLSLENEMKYRGIFRAYFHDSGFNEITFLEEGDSNEEMNQKFSNADVLYLPGGDPKILKEKMEKGKVPEMIRNFKGITIGNSAGAIVLCKGGYSDQKFYKGFGLVNIYVNVHLKVSEIPKSRNDKAMTIGIPEDLWISISLGRWDAP